MFGERTPLPYWIVGPILGGTAGAWMGVIAWAIIGGITTSIIMKSRGRNWWFGALIGGLTGGIGGILFLAPLWFVIIPLLDKECAECGTKNRPSAATCQHCGHRFTESAWQEWLFSTIFNTARVVITIELALIVSSILLEVSGKDPLDTYRVLFEWGLGTSRARANSLLAATPLILTGLATAVAFRAGVFNIGVEGSLYMGGIAAAWVGFTFVNWSRIPLIVFAFVMAALFGGIWGFIPGYLKARLRVDEVVSTIMLNYVAIELTSYMVQSGPFFVPGMANAMSEQIAAQAQLPRLVERSQLNSSLYLALAMVVVMMILMRRTKLGFELRMVGDNPLFSRWAGIPKAAVIMQVMFLSGLIGGLAGAGQVLGVHYNFTARFSRGFGFDGITIALLGRNSPLGVLIGSLLFGVLRSGGTTIEVFTDVPIDLVDIIQALIILFVAIDLNLNWLQQRKRRSEPPESSEVSAAPVTS